MNIQICDAESASTAWQELEHTGSGYQTQAFTKAYAAAFDISVTVAVARDAAGTVIAVLPLLLVFALSSGRLIEGLTAGTLKP